MVVRDRNSTGSSGGIESNLARATPAFNARQSPSLTRPGSVSSLRLMTLITRLVVLALILSLVTGCEERTASEELTPPMSEDSYVAVMAELARVRRRPPHARGQVERDRLADSVRTDVLLRHGVTAAELIEFADVVGSDPSRMQSLTERIETFADSIETSTVRADSVRSDSIARAQSSDGQDGLLETDTLVADSGRATVDGSEARTAEPGARFADPDLASTMDSGGQIEPTAGERDSLAAADSASTREQVPPTGAAPIRPRPGSARRPARRPPPAESDSTSDPSNHGATGENH